MLHRSNALPLAPPVVPPPLPCELASARRHVPDAGSPEGVSPPHRFLAPFIGTACVVMGTACLLVGWVATERGSLSENDTASKKVEWPREQPQLEQLTSVTLAIRPDTLVVANQETTAAEAADQLVSAQHRVEPPAIADTLPVDANAARPFPTANELALPERVAYQKSLTNAVDSKTTATATDRVTHSHDNLAALLWGERESSLPESLMELASPTSLLHGMAENKTCADSTMPALGTALKWADQPADAYRIAAEQQKLVFLIHVSGNFEIPGYT